MWETTAGKLSGGSAAKRARPAGAAATAASRTRSGTLLSGLGMGVLLFIRLSSGARVSRGLDTKSTTRACPDADANSSHRRAKKRSSRVPAHASAATADQVRGFDFSFKLLSLFLLRFSSDDKSTQPL
jgi:hypothetical protein